MRQGNTNGDIWITVSGCPANNIIKLEEKQNWENCKGNAGKTSEMEDQLIRTYKVLAGVRLGWRGW